MVNVTLLLLATPPTVTTTLTTPFDNPEGTTAVMDLLPQAVVDATAPPNVMVLVPLLLPKLFPVTVTDVPDGPEVGERLVMLGAAANSEAEVRMMNEKAVKARSTARQVERITIPLDPIWASAQLADTCRSEAWFEPLQTLE